MTYFESFCDFWLPIYRKQTFKAKFNNDIDWLFSIKENIYKNWHFDDAERKYLIEELGIKYLFGRRK